MDESRTEDVFGPSFLALTLPLEPDDEGPRVATLWAARKTDRIAALVLNSPWLDTLGTTLLKRTARGVLTAVSRHVLAAHATIAQGISVSAPILVLWARRSCLRQRPGPPLPRTCDRVRRTPRWRATGCGGRRRATGCS
jgi:hypothetical protein